jgi:hypothetical protein
MAKVTGVMAIPQVTVMILKISKAEQVLTFCLSCQISKFTNFFKQRRFLCQINIRSRVRLSSRCLTT